MQSNNAYASIAGQGEDMHDPEIVICRGWKWHLAHGEGHVSGGRSAAVQADLN